MARKPNIVLIMSDQQRAAAFAACIRREIAKWSKVVRSAGITPE